MVFQLYKYSTHYYVIFGFSSPKNMDIFKSKSDNMIKNREKRRSVSKKLLLLGSKE
jgi:hypothetical protein